MRDGILAKRLSLIVMSCSHFCIGQGVQCIDNACIITFEKASASPKILDLQIKSQNNTGAFTLTPEEVVAVRKPPVQPIAKQKK